MRARTMRLIVYFDLPMKTADDRRQYTRFRKYLQMHGFIMVQESVYSKIAVNATAAESIRKNLRNNRPGTGNVIILSVSEKQYQSMEFLVGESQKEIVDSLDRFVVL